MKDEGLDMKDKDVNGVLFLGFFYEKLSPFLLLCSEEGLLLIQKNPRIKYEGLAEKLPCSIFKLQTLLTGLLFS